MSDVLAFIIITRITITKTGFRKLLLKPDETQMLGKVAGMNSSWHEIRQMIFQGSNLGLSRIIRKYHLIYISLIKHCCGKLLLNYFIEIAFVFALFALCLKMD